MPRLAQSYEHHNIIFMHYLSKTYATSDMPLTYMILFKINKKHYATNVKNLDKSKCEYVRPRPLQGFQQPACLITTGKITQP